MKLIEKTYSYFINKKQKTIEEKKNLLIDFLKQLQLLESKLWGVTLNNISEVQEEVLEDTNHLIYLITQKQEKELVEIFKFKDTSLLIKDLKELKKDFLYLKNEIKKRDKLKNLLSQFTIKLVDENNYLKLENIFLLERQLYEVLDRQEEELENLYNNFPKINLLQKQEKTQEFIKILKNIRTILSGHLTHQKIWQEEREGFSNTSNILYQLIKIVENV